MARRKVSAALGSGAVVRKPSFTLPAKGGTVKRSAFLAQPQRSSTFPVLPRKGWTVSK